MYVGFHADYPFPIYGCANIHDSSVYFGLNALASFSFVACGESIFISYLL